MAPHEVHTTGGDSILAPNRLRLTSGIVLVVSFIAFEAIAVATVLPVVLRHLGDIRLYGWAFSAFMLAQLVGIVVAGPVVDGAGMARPLLVAVVLFAAGLLVDGTAPSMAVLVVGRAVQGVGAGVITVTLNVLVGRGYPPASRPRAYAAMSTAWVLPGVIGPVVAGAVAESLSWRLVFLAIVPAVLAAAAVAVPAVARAEADASRAAPGSRAPGGASAAVAVALAAGTALVLDALGARQPVLSPLLAVAGLAVAVPALRAVLSSSRVVAGGRQLGTMWVAASANLAFFGAEAFVPLSLTSLHHRSVTEAGAVLTVAALTWTAGSWVQAHYLARVGPRVLCAAGLALVAAGVGGVGFLDWASTPWWVGFIAWAVAGAGMGLTYATATLVVLASAGAGAPGGPVAALGVLVTLGVAVGAGIGGASLTLSVALGDGRAPGLRAFDAIATVVALVGLGLTATVPRGVPGGGGDGTA